MKKTILLVTLVGICCLCSAQISIKNITVWPDSSTKICSGKTPIFLIEIDNNSDSILYFKSFDVLLEDSNTVVNSFLFDTKEFINQTSSKYTRFENLNFTVYPKKKKTYQIFVETKYDKKGSFEVIIKHAVYLNGAQLVIDIGVFGKQNFKVNNSLLKLSAKNVSDVLVEITLDTTELNSWVWLYTKKSRTSSIFSEPDKYITLEIESALCLERITLYTEPKLSFVAWWYEK